MGCGCAVVVVVICTVVSPAAYLLRVVLWMVYISVCSCCGCCNCVVVIKRVASECGCCEMWSL